MPMKYVYKEEELVALANRTKEVIVFCPEEITHFEMPATGKMSSKDLRGGAEVRAKKNSPNPNAPKSVAVLLIDRRRAVAASVDIRVPEAKAPITSVSMLALMHWKSYLSGQFAVYSFAIDAETVALVGVADDGSIASYRLLRTSQDLISAEITSFKDALQRAARSRPVALITNSEVLDGDFFDFEELELPPSAFFYRKTPIYYKTPLTVAAFVFAIFSIVSLWTPIHEFYRVYKPYRAVYSETSKIRSQLRELRANVKYIEKVKHLNPQKVTDFLNVSKVASSYFVSIDVIAFEPGRKGIVKGKIWGGTKEFVTTSMKDFKKKVRQRFKNVIVYEDSVLPQTKEGWYEIPFTLDFGDVDASKKRKVAKSFEAPQEVRGERVQVLVSDAFSDSVPYRRLRPSRIFVPEEGYSREAQRNHQTAKRTVSAFERIKQSAKSWFSFQGSFEGLAYAAENKALPVPPVRGQVEVRDQGRREVQVLPSRIHRAPHSQGLRKPQAERRSVRVPSRQEASKSRAPAPAFHKRKRTVHHQILSPRGGQVAPTAVPSPPKRTTSHPANVYVEHHPKPTSSKSTRAPRPLPQPPRASHGPQSFRPRHTAPTVVHTPKPFVQKSLMPSQKNPKLPRLLSKEEKMSKEAELKKKKLLEEEQAQLERRKILRLLEEISQKERDLSKAPTEDVRTALTLLKRELERTQRLLQKRREEMKREPKIIVKNPASLYLVVGNKKEAKLSSANSADYSLTLHPGDMFQFESKTYKVTELTPNQAIAISTDFEVKLIFMHLISPPRIYNPGGLRIVKQENGISYISSDPVTRLRTVERTSAAPQGTETTPQTPHERLGQTLDSLSLVNLAKTLELHKGSQLLMRLPGSDTPLLFICKAPEKDRQECVAEGSETIIFLARAQIKNKVINPVETYYYGFEDGKIYLTHAKVRVGIRPNQVFTLKDIIMPEYLELSRQAKMTGTYNTDQSATANSNSLNEAGSTVSFGTTMRLNDLREALRDPFFFLELYCGKPEEDKVVCESEFGDKVIFSRAASQIVFNPSDFRVLFTFKGAAYLYNGKDLLKVKKNQEMSGLDFGLSASPFPYTCSSISKEKVVCEDKNGSKLVFLESPVRKLFINPNGFEFLDFDRSKVVLANKDTLIKFSLNEKLSPEPFDIDQLKKMPFTCTRPEPSTIFCTAEDGSTMLFLKNSSFQTVINPKDFALVSLEGKEAIISDGNDYYKIAKNQYIDGKAFGLEEDFKPLHCRFYSTYVECSNEINKRILFLMLTEYQPFINPGGFYLRTTYKGFGIVSNGETFYKILDGQYIDGQTFGLRDQRLLPFKCQVEKTQIECATKDNKRMLFLKTAGFNSLINPQGFSLISVVNKIALISDGQNYYRIYDGQLLDGHVFSVNENLLPFKCKVHKREVICSTDENRKMIFLEASALNPEDTNLDSSGSSTGSSNRPRNSSRGSSGSSSSSSLNSSTSSSSTSSTLNNTTSLTNTASTTSTTPSTNFGNTTNESSSQNLSGNETSSTGNSTQTSNSRI